MPDKLLKCSLCEYNIRKNSASISCNLCFSWVHKGCSGLSNNEFKELNAEWKKSKNHSWVCDSCKLVQASGQDQQISNVQHRTINVDFTSAKMGTDLASDIGNILNKGDVNIKDLLIVITQLFNMITKQNDTIQSMLSEVQNYKLLNDKISFLEGEVKNLKDECKNLKTAAIPSTSIQGTEQQLPDSNPEIVLLEMQERMIRAKNIIIHNIPESKAEDTTLRMSHDNNLVKDIFSKIEVTIDNFKSFRLGRTHGNNLGNNRPLKVILPDENSTKLCLKNRMKLVEMNHEARISADMTIAQRNLLKSLHQELARRKENGEDNIIIRYFQGTPKIVKSKPKEVPKN